jgi:DNA-binding transcriptional regulator YiaG
MSETTVKENVDSLDDVIHAQKQLDEELQQLKNRYSRYTQLVSYQQEEEDYLLKNKEHVNPKRISLSLKRKKDVTYGLMPHDDIVDSFEKEESVKEEKKSLEEMSKTANSFIDSIRKKAQLKPKEFELPPPVPKESFEIKEKEQEKLKKKEKEEEEEEVKEEGEHQEKEMNRLCDLVQSLLSEAQDAIDTKPSLSHPDIGKEEEEEDELPIPKRLQSLKSYRSSRILDGLDETSSVSNKHLSVMTDSTAIAQPLAPVNTHCGDDFDDFDKYSMTSKNFDCLNSPYNAMASTPNEEFMKDNNTMSEGMNYYPKFYPPPEYFYGPPPPPVGYPPYFDPAYGPIPPYLWEEIQKQRMGLNGEESSSVEASVNLKSQKEDQEVFKHTTTTTTTTTTEVKKDKKSVVEGKTLVKKRHRRKHHRRIRPVDADGNLCENDSQEKSLVKKKESSKLFKAQFGSDTQLFLSFFASFFVTSILVTISCLWSVIQVMAGNVNDKNLSRLLMSSSESAIKNNKKKIDLILDKRSNSESEDDSESEDSNESKLLTYESSDSQTKSLTESSDDEDDDEDEDDEDDENEVVIPSKFKDGFNATNLNACTTSLKNINSSVNTHRRRNSL